MGDMENLRADVENWYDPDGEDIHCAGHIECVVECDMCGDYEKKNETILFCGKRICSHCAERILDEYEERRTES